MQAEKGEMYRNSVSRMMHSKHMLGPTAQCKPARGKDQSAFSYHASYKILADFTYYADDVGFAME
jgi:hypothetical protein